MINTDSKTDFELENELLRPDYVFAGTPLWPKGRAATRLWYLLINAEYDLDSIQTLALMWILQKRGGATAGDDLREAVKEVYADRDKVRGDLFAWVDKLTEADEAEGKRIRLELEKAEARTAIVVAPAPGQKKMEATHPPSGDTSSNSSPSIAGGRKKRPSTKRASRNKTPSSTATTIGKEIGSSLPPP
jgi:hypothetical protein